MSQRELSPSYYFRQFRELFDDETLQLKLTDAVELLTALKESRGRLFILGIGGSASNASHAVNDFRRLCGIDAYTPLDNMGEFSAAANDDGWSNVFTKYFQTTPFRSNDMLLVFSVGGGNIEKQVSMGLIDVVDAAKNANARVISVLGKSDGYCAEQSDVALVCAPQDDGLITPISEAMQAVVWHYFVSHPLLKVRQTVW